MQEQGLRVDSILDDFVVSPVQATDDPHTVGAVDVVIVSVKAWQLPEAALAILPLLDSNTVVLPLLNGVEAVDILSECVGAEHVVGGLCRIGAQIVDPGHILHSGIEPTVVLGEMDDRASDRVKRLHRAFVEAEVKAEIAANILVALWEKFMLIATWSGIGAVTRAPIGRWRALPGTRSMAEACLQEILGLAHARGIAVPKSRVRETLDFFDTIPPDGTASMQRDMGSRHWDARHF
jgi:2-dehydropantoate 2-reductase